MSNLPTFHENLSDQFDNAADGRLSDLTDDQSKLVNDWTTLGSLLRELPVSPADLASAVRGEIEDATLVVAASQQSIQSPRRSKIAVLASSLTIATCLLSLMYFPAPLSGPTFQQSLHSGFTSRELASGVSNCDVVMITMSQGPEATTDFLRTSLTNRGMEAHSIGIDSQPSSNSQLLGSNADSEEIWGALTAMNDAVDSEPIDDLQREEILAQLLVAIETPSLAEEHFDDYVVVLPRDVIADMRKDVGMIADSASPKDSGIAPAIVPAETRKLVFVVRRKKVASPDRIDKNGASLQTPNASTIESA